MKIGSIVLGRYCVIDFLEQGGTTELFLVNKLHEHTENKEKNDCVKTNLVKGDYAILKMLRPFFRDDEELKEIFQDEIALMQLMNHRNIVKFCEQGQIERENALILEYILGENLAILKDTMKQKGLSFPLSCAIDMGLQLLEALDYIHGLHKNNIPLEIIHRDITPANILIRLDGTVKLSDFGIARYRKNAHQHDTDDDIRGTFAYLAPELFDDGVIVDQRIDLFAWAVVMWELLAEQSLFKGNSPDKTLENVRHLSIPSLQDIKPDIPDNIAQIIHKNLSRQPHDRYKNALSTHQDLTLAYQKKWGKVERRLLSRLVCQHRIN